MKPTPTPRVLVVYRHYWPDTTPYAPILRQVLGRMVQRGAAVTAFAGQPCYNGPQPRRPRRETIDGVRVRRIRTLPGQARWKLVRTLNTLYFVLRAVLHGVTHKYDLLLANGNPPVLAGLALRVISRLTGARYVLHLQDLHPEALQTLNTSRPGVLYRTALAVETRNCLAADLIVTLSTDMQRSLARRGVPAQQVRLINNCPLADAPDADARLPECLTDPSATRFLFAGNLGRFQGLDVLLQAFLRLRDRDDWRLVFMGAGPARAALQAAAGDLLGKRIHFIDRQPIGVAVAAMHAADYGLTPLAASVVRYAFPSKLCTYLSTGLPSVALCETDSELARVLAEHRLGVAAPPGDAQAIAARLQACLEQPLLRSPEERRRIAETADHLYGTRQMLAKWDAVLDELLGPQHCPAPALPIAA